jgi:hypothetical protein
MNPEESSRKAVKRARAALQRLENDERGAVLVLGVFMAACVAGMLWYLAGIGDAIIYRQRMQEASDAAAFSAAVLHARGMNLIVLLNLIMACVLGVRVTLRAIAAGLVVAGTIVAFIPPISGFAPALFNGARAMESAVRATRNPINNTIKALAKAQDGLRLVAPGAALAGSYQVGSKYGPIVSHSAAGNPFTSYGLPVEKGTTDRLCKEAGEAVTGILLWAMPGSIDPRVTDRAKGLIGKAVEKGGVFFCELGKGTAPDFGSDVDGAAKEQCGKEEGELSTKVNQAESQYLARCRALGAVCDGGSEPGKLSPAERAELANLRASRDSAISAVAGFDEKTCREKKRTEADEKMKKEAGGAGSNAGPTQADLDAMRPAKIAASYKNGIDGAQLLAVSKGSEALLGISPTGVQAGAWNRGEPIDIPATAFFSFAQAEYFYDCSGKWEGIDCNGADADGAEAMWHFRWRARLRRYNAPFGTSGNGLDNLSEGLAHILFVAGAARMDPSRAFAGDNVVILNDLRQAFTSDMIIH